MHFRRVRHLQCPNSQAGAGDESDVAAIRMPVLTLWIFWQSGSARERTMGTNPGLHHWAKVLEY
jgi:hypothetical protein